MHDRMAMDPQNADEMTTIKKKAALQYLMFLKQKRCGKIKGRGCADGRKQHKYLTKDNTSAPTVATEALFLTCLINSMELHKFSTVNIPGAFMQADMEGETVHMKLEGKMSELPTKRDPKLYQKYVTKKRENGALCGFGKSPTWHAPGSAPVLEKFDVKPTGVGVRNKPLRMVRVKQERYLERAM